jgi:hypothetical protein
LQIAFFKKAYISKKAYSIHNTNVSFNSGSISNSLLGNSDDKTSTVAQGSIYRFVKCTTKYLVNSIITQ